MACYHVRIYSNRFILVYGIDLVYIFTQIIWKET